MQVEELLAVLCYFAVLLMVGFLSPIADISLADRFHYRQQIDELLADSACRSCKRYEQLVVHGVSGDCVYWRAF